MLCKRLLSFLAFSLLTGAGWLGAQSNEFLDGLLAEKEAPLGSTVYLALAAVGRIPETASLDEALAAARESGWPLPDKPAETPVRLGGYAALLMRAFDLPGGLMYRLFPGPRYAVRELAFLGAIHGRPDPARKLSGEEVVRILSILLESREERS